MEGSKNCNNIGWSVGKGIQERYRINDQLQRKTKEIVKSGKNSTKINYEK